ncbi:MAG: hypothetical protein IKR07_01595, partial [Oscillospiraceae bacterium]|nr:hypothetical protein [Oscillospiraceae bacterium]
MAEFEHSGRGSDSGLCCFSDRLCSTGYRTEEGSGKVYYGTRRKRIPPPPAEAGVSCAYYDEKRH